MEDAQGSAIQAPFGPRILHAVPDFSSCLRPASLQTNYGNQFHRGAGGRLEFSSSRLDIGNRHEGDPEIDYRPVGPDSKADSIDPEIRLLALSFILYIYDILSQPSSDSGIFLLLFSYLDLYCRVCRRYL
jgi:hypothetical protein